MKRILLYAFALLFSAGIFAQANEFGIVVGGLNGLSYKRIINKNFAIQTDLGIGFQRTSVMENAYYDYALWNVDVFDFALNANFLYNKKLSNGLYAFIGGGPNVGFVQELPHSAVSFGKFGANAMLGTGYKMSNFPLTFSLDFRPGYALLLNYKYETILHMFDWHLAFSARYCF